MSIRLPEYRCATLPNRLWPSLLIAGSLSLSACGGGASNTNSAASNTLSGTAAGGAPVIGTVTVKDAKGKLVSTNLAADGSYSVDISALTAPLLLEAQGHVGGTQVTYVSAYAAGDAKTVNITPFTDLLIANVAGQAANQYFNSPDYSKLSTTQLNAAKTALTQRLLPALQNVGLDAGFDLLHSAFAADHTKFDALMDTIKVSVDTQKNTALIRDILNKTQITDNFAAPTDATPLPTPVLSLTGGGTDIQNIANTLTAFSALFRNGIPADNAALRGLLASDGSFLQGGRDIDGWVLQMTTDGTLQGLQLLNPVLVDDARNTPTKRHVSMQVTQPHRASDVYDMFMLKGNDGVWRMDGDQRSVSNSLIAANWRFVPGALQPSWLKTSSQFSRELELWIDYAPPAVQYLRMDGPGLGGASVYLHRIVNSSSSTWGIVNLDGSDGSNQDLHACGDPDATAAQTCIDFSQVPDDAVFTFIPLDDAKATIATAPAYTRILPRPPVSNTDAMANATAWFATYTGSTPASARSVTANSAVTISFIMPTDTQYGFNDLNFDTPVETEDPSLMNADGHSVTTTWTTTPSTRIGLSLWIQGPYGRQFMTAGEIPF